ncbi:hypothetical protein LG634_19430 [Streptomyces bambusae]|uniref:hypothetical protein n=1 Tax=Streptomyces bambusae TaxID=1550616 RepID=UPI001CFDA213|nr:hypothetical protein [Streptomyces bambusae]MCB5167002.1 hypothetical protein [Streptomyces bambusae]
MIAQPVSRVRQDVVSGLVHGCLAGPDVTDDVDEGPKRVDAVSAAGPIGAGRGCELPVTFELGMAWTVKGSLVSRRFGGLAWDSLCEPEAGSGGDRVRLGVSVPPAGLQAGSSQEAMDDYEGVTMANYGEYESDWRRSQLRVAGREAGRFADGHRQELHEASPPQELLTGLIQSPGDLAMVLVG